MDGVDAYHGSDVAVQGLEKPCVGVVGQSKDLIYFLQFPLWVSSGETV